MGFAVKNSLLSSIFPLVGGTERILKLQLQSSAGPVSLISAYAPTLTSLSEAKDSFCDELSAVITEVHRQEPLFILGDFNVRVGADHSSWPSSLSHHGIGKMDENGQRFHELCCHHNLCITNTYHKTKPQRRVSWRHPRSKHRQQLDLAITRCSSLNSIQLTRSYQSCRLRHRPLPRVLQGEASVAETTPLQERRKAPHRHQQDLAPGEGRSVCQRTTG